MGILLIGASGRTGKLVIDEVLSRGQSVTALVRSTSSLSSRSGLTVVQGTPTNASDIERAIASTPPADRITSIIVTLNAVRASDSPFAKSISPPRLLADSHANLVAAMQNYPEIRKIVTMSAWGVAESIRETPWLFRLLIRKSNMAVQFEDHDMTDREMKESGVNFVLVRPVRLAEGEKKAVKVHGNTGKGLGLMASISRKSVAGFLVDCAQVANWDRRTPVVSE